jgi:hypothetical protein
MAIFNRSQKLLITLATFLFTIIIILLAFIIGVFYANKNIDKSQTIVTSQVVFDKINSQSFLLTKTAYLQQESQIKIDQGSDWSNFLWGQTIDATALMKVDLGCDLSGLSIDNIKVDTNNKTIIIELPKATISNITNVSDIQIKSNSGILKFIFDNDPNSDFNRSLVQLKADSRLAVEGNSELITSAQEDTKKILKALFVETGYQLIIEIV